MSRFRPIGIAELHFPVEGSLRKTIKRPLHTNFTTLQRLHGGLQRCLHLLRPQKRAQTSPSSISSSISSISSTKQHQHHQPSPTKIQFLPNLHLRILRSHIQQKHPNRLRILQLAKVRARAGIRIKAKSKTTSITTASPAFIRHFQPSSNKLQHNTITCGEKAKKNPTMLKYLNIKSQLDDILTKSLAKVEHAFFTRLLGLRPRRRAKTKTKATPQTYKMKR
jgi:hypothetical protein